MIGSELKQLTTDILDGVVIDDDFYYILLNIAKTKLEEMRAWHYLKKLNSDYSGYNSAGFALPDDFASSYKVFVNTNLLTPISFDEQHVYQQAGLRYYIDLAADKFYLTDINSSGPIYFYYKRFTDDLTSSTSPAFPVRFHSLLSFYVAAYYQNGIDSDELFARMAPENRVAAIELQRAMEAWDANIAYEAKDNRLGMSEGNPGVALSQM